MSQSKKNLENEELLQRRVLSGLYELNKKMRQVLLDTSRHSENRFVLKNSIKTLNEEIHELERKKEDLYQLLRKRMSTAFLLSRKSIVDILISQNSLAQLDRNLRILGLISQRDLKKMKQYSLISATLNQKKENLQKRYHKLVGLEEKLTLLESKLQKEQEMKRKLLLGIKQKSLFVKKKMDDLREASLKAGYNDSATLDAIFKPSFGDQKGLLPLPVNGTVIRNFGPQIDKEFKFSINSKGLFFESEPHEVVKAVYDGKVSYLGRLNGMNHIMILDHGDHYYSIYAHLNQIKVKLGDEVKQHQAVAQTSYSPIDQKNGIYFEIRHFSEPYNPTQWMRGLNL